MLPKTNPYNFVRLAGTTPAKRISPGTHASAQANRHSGRLVCRLVALSPIFIPYRLPRSEVQPGVYEELPLPPSGKLRTRNHKRFLQFFHTGDNIPRISASTLKGEIRSIAEALSNSCVSLFSGRYPGLEGEIHLPVGFQACSDKDKLCPACRLFGMATESAPQNNTEADKLFFRGKVSFSDALLLGKPLYRPPVLLIELSNPKPSHRLYYFPDGKHAVGRKFYYHTNDLEPLAETRPLSTAALPYNLRDLLYRNGVHQPTEADLLALYRDRRNWPANSRDGLHRKVTVRPLERGAVFEFTVDYVNLSDHELALLVLSLELVPRLNLREDGSLDINDQNRLVMDENHLPKVTGCGVYHKIGYGKPAGLGSAAIYIVSGSQLSLAERYSGSGDGFSPLPSGMELRAWAQEQKTDCFKWLGAHQDAANPNINIWPQQSNDLFNILRWPNQLDIGYPDVNDPDGFSTPLPIPGNETRENPPG